MKMVKCLPEFEFFFFAVFLNNGNFISKMRRSKVADYAAVSKSVKWSMRPFSKEQGENYKYNYKEIEWFTRCACSHFILL